MRRTFGFTTETCLWQCRIVNRQPSCQRLSAGSTNSAPHSRVAFQPQAQRHLSSSRIKQRKKATGQPRQAGVLQSSADFQLLTRWLIAGGVEGISGDTQKVEIYQYGEDGRGLRATKVLYLPPQPIPMVLLGYIPVFRQGCVWCQQDTTAQHTGSHRRHCRAQDRIGRGSLQMRKGVPAIPV